MASYVGTGSPPDPKKPKSGGPAGTSQSNGTIGRILATPCDQLPSIRIKSHEELHEELKEDRQAYNDYRSGKLKLSGQEAVELRERISRLSGFLEPGESQLWPAPNEAEQAYIDARTAKMRRDANNLGIAAAGPVLGFLPLVARLFNAPEEVVEQLGELNIDLGMAYWAHGEAKQSRPLGVPEGVAEPRNVRRSQRANRKSSESNKGKSRGGVTVAAKQKYNRSMSERRKALLRDAKDPNSKLDPEARQYVLDNNGERVPEGYEVSHKIPIEAGKTLEEKAALDVAKNMETIEKPIHRAMHRVCGSLYHFMKL